MEMEKVLELIQTLHENGYTGMENGYIRAVDYIDEYPSEYIEFSKELCWGNDCTTQGFGGYNLKYTELIWRKKILEIILGKSMFKIRKLSVLSDEIFDYENYKKEITGAPLTLLIKDSLIKGIVNLSNARNVDEVFIPSISEEFQNSNDAVEVIKAYASAQEEIASIEEKIRLDKIQIEEYEKLLETVNNIQEKDEILNHLGQKQFSVEQDLKEVETLKKQLFNFDSYADTHKKDIEIVMQNNQHSETVQSQPGNSES